MDNWKLRHFDGEAVVRVKLKRLYNTGTIEFSQDGNPIAFSNASALADEGARCKPCGYGPVVLDKAKVSFWGNGELRHIEFLVQHYGAEVTTKDGLLDDVVSASFDESGKLREAVMGRAGMYIYKHTQYPNPNQTLKFCGDESVLCPVI